MSLEISRAVMVSLLVFAGCARADSWKELPPGNKKLALAESIAERGTLVGKPLSEVVQILGEPRAVRNGYAYYVAKNVTKADGFDLNAHYLLACQIDDSQRVTLCVVQGD